MATVALLPYEYGKRTTMTTLNKKRRCISVSSDCVFDPPRVFWTWTLWDGKREHSGICKISLSVQFHKSKNVHVPFPTMLNSDQKCADSILNEALWDMEQVHSRICDLGQLVLTLGLRGYLVNYDATKFQHIYTWILLFQCGVVPHRRFMLFAGRIYMTRNIWATLHSLMLFNTKPVSEPTL